MKLELETKSTRDAILDATDVLLAKHGYKNMTIDHLADEVGIGKGSVYLHFSSKEEIALSHIDRIIERIKNALVAISQEKSAVDDRLRNMLLERVLLRYDSTQHYTQSLNELLAYLRPKLLERRKHYFEEEAQLLASVIAEGQKEKRFAAGDHLDLARTMVTATNSLLPYSLSALELGDRDEIVDRVHKTADLMIKGLSLGA